MSSRARHAVHAIRACAAAVAIAAMMIVPALVFAGPQHYSAASRLARGFEPPPSKVSGPAAAPARPAAAAPLAPIPADPCSDSHEPLPRAVPLHRPHDRRGPPALFA